MRTLSTLLCGGSIVWLSFAVACHADDWNRFRGPNGNGSVEAGSIPLSWDENTNIKWQQDLPGPGSSSPIVINDHIFLTCYTGYGVGEGGSGEIGDLKRHLLCLNRDDGYLLWQKTVPARLPEDSYRGFITEHGYATSTPVSNGEIVVTFFGKSGVFAYDMEGNQLWQADVGQESSSRAWGSASSPIIYEDMVIINASDENQAVYAFELKTGKELWKAQAAGLELSFNTPVIIQTTEQKDYIALAVPYEIWGLNPETGKLSWYVETDCDRNVSPSLVTHHGTLYGIGGREGAGIALQPKGNGDLTESATVWTNRYSSYVPSPVYQDGRLYFVTDKAIAHCINAESGELVYRERLDVPAARGPAGGFYASPVLINDHFIIPSRRNGTLVIKTGDEFQQVSHNVIASDDTDFNASPAVSRSSLLLRSNKRLYCIAE